MAGSRRPEDHGRNREGGDHDDQNSPACVRDTVVSRRVEEPPWGKAIPLVLVPHGRVGGGRPGEGTEATPNVPDCSPEAFRMCEQCTVTDTLNCTEKDRKRSSVNEDSGLKRQADTDVLEVESGHEST